MEVNPVIISLSGTVTESGRSTEPDDTCPAEDNPGDGSGMSPVEKAIRNAVETAKAQGESQMHLLRGKVIQLERALQDKNGEVKKLKDQLEDKDKKLEKSELERKKAEGELVEIKKGLVDLLGKVGGRGSGEVPGNVKILPLGNPGSSGATQEASVEMEEDQGDSEDSEASDPPMGLMSDPNVNQSRKESSAPTSPTCPTSEGKLGRQNVQGVSYGRGPRTRKPFSCKVNGCRGKYGPAFELHFHPQGSKGNLVKTPTYYCNQCGESFARRYDLGVHQREAHESE